jgi:D-serine deaminase-like pyridoxal phosphate-dependent protein
MKTLVKFYQNEGSYSFESEVTNESLSTYTGTALNRLFDYVNVAKKIGAKTMTYSKPINLLIEVDGKKFDTGTCKESLQAKLKLQRTNDGYKRFAVRTYELIKFSTMSIAEVGMNDVLESL